jgi:ParB/RepB/Spo0J family partition protein
MPSRKKAPRPAAGATRSHSPEEIPPANIRQNPRNPRLVFPQARIEALAESIAEVGLLVPLTVYHDPAKGEPEYVLLDGERRWRAATLINKPTVPAWVIPKPSGVDNTLRMFNIHMMRDEWGEMATALALKDIMAEFPDKNDVGLRKITGLGVDRIKNMRRVLNFPKEWQGKVLAEEIPFNLLVELDKAILAKKRDPKRADVLKGSESELRDFFLNKYQEGSLGDVVDLRKVGTLIDTASSSHIQPRVRRRARTALNSLLSGRVSIAEAYQYGAAASVEIRGIIRDVDDLPDRILSLGSSELEDDQRNKLVTALLRLQKALVKVLSALRDAT